MKTKNLISTATLAILVCLSTLNLHLSTFAQGTAFNYQGYLAENGAPAQGTHALRFTLYGSDVGGTPIGPTNTLDAVPVSNGLFTVTLDFGSSAFDGSARWLDIGVRTNASGADYAPLAPRQLITPTPYAIYAGNAGMLDGVGGRNYAPATGSSNYVGNALGSALAETGQIAVWTGLSSIGGSPQLVWDGSNSRFGINTASPQAELDVRGNSHLLGTTLSKIYGNSDEANYYIGHYPVEGSDGLDIHWYGGVRIGTAVGVAVQVLGNGNVGIGTTSPDSLLHVKSASSHAMITTDSAEGSESGIFISEAGARKWEIHKMDSTDELNFWSYDGSKSVLTMQPSGNVGIGTTAPQSKLHVSGEITTKAVNITAGADIAEPFPVTGPDIPKGSVVVIDDTQPGQLKLSDRAYDTRVAGIVSGAGGVNSGITLRQEGAQEGTHNVALTGRVYALADASANPIKPGDLLTTADSPGYCMKVTDRDKANGAILGKAMSSLKEGQGLILVLVTLQ